MFKTAALRTMRRISSALLLVSLTMLLGACAHTSPPEPDGMKSWRVENVAGKSTAELYTDVIEPGVFELSSSKVIDGYIVESGNLRMLDKSMGSLVTVRSADGSLTAAVEKPGESGWLVINSKGEGRFLSNPSEDYSLPDTIIDNARNKGAKSSGKSGPYVIDMLVGFSRAAVVGGDATANALALVEGVNLALRNSQVRDVSVKLAGVQVIEQNYPIVGDTLDKIPQLFSVGIEMYDPDMVSGVFAGHPGDNAGGYGFMPGNFSIGHNSVEVFRHEVGHNAGGHHCYKDGGGLVPYGYGFDNGKTHTAQCGNNSSYYSTPSVLDQHGLRIGDASTADMARVWRENAQRLFSYHKTVKAPTGFSVAAVDHSNVYFKWNGSVLAVKYEIWGRTNIWLPPKKLAESMTTDGVVTNVSPGALPYYVIAVDAGGRKSPASNTVYAKPYNL
jgi:hypothetical protein